jgi:hypothetical protein
MYSFIPIFRISLLLISTILLPFTKGRAQQEQTASSNTFMLPDSTYTIPFEWLGDSVNGQWEPHAAMLLPIQFKGSDRTFFMQFDLGSAYSMFYSGKLNLLKKDVAAFTQLEAAAMKAAMHRFQIGQLPVIAESMVFKTYGTDTATILVRGKRSLLIGTIGTDMIRDRLMIIDYPKQNIMIGPASDSALLKDMQLRPMYFAGGRILLPATILQKNTLLYFDTGTSAFSLLTDQQSYNQLAAPGTTAQVYKVNSWGNTLLAHKKPSNQFMQMASQQIAIGSVTYIEGANAAMAGQMKKAGIGGMLGNLSFLSYQLLIDTKHQRFGLKK